MGPRVRGDDSNYCVFATRGGAAVVTNVVASSIAGPSGVSKDEWHQWGFMVRDGANAPPHHEGPSLEERSLSARSASNRPNLFHSATAMRSRLKLWNESGTKRARIADSYPNPIRSPQHLALKRLGRH